MFYALDDSTIRWYYCLMRLGSEKVKSLCAERGISIGELLKQAGVSRNAYYSLARRDSLLPRTVQALANGLAVEESELLTSESREVEKTHALMKEVDRIVKRHPGTDPENVRHTLLLLREKPIERLRRALMRAQGSHFQSKKALGRCKDRLVLPVLADALKARQTSLHGTPWNRK